MSHIFKSKVFFHDVDKGGVVYFANYLKYLDNARTTLFNELGYGFTEQEKAGKIFAVASLNIKYRKSLLLDEEFTVTTKIQKVSNVSIEIYQEIVREGQIVTSAEMKLACLDFNNGQRIAAIPEWLRPKISQYQ